MTENRAQLAAFGASIRRARENSLKQGIASLVKLRRTNVKENEKHRTLAALEADLAVASEAVSDLEIREDSVRSELCRAQNHYDKLSKEFDAAVEAMKATAPRDSRWRMDARKTRSKVKMTNEALSPSPGCSRDEA